MARTEIRGTQIVDASVDLTADVTGTLQVNKGGTGKTVPLVPSDVGLNLVNNSTQVTYVAVTDGTEARPTGAVFVQWVDAPGRVSTTAPSNMTSADIWLKKT